MNKIRVPEVLTWATVWMPLPDEYKKRNNKREDRKEGVWFETS